jgi:hypothetical protein
LSITSTHCEFENEASEAPVEVEGSYFKRSWISFFVCPSTAVEVTLDLELFVFGVLTKLPLRPYSTSDQQPKPTNY